MIRNFPIYNNSLKSKARYLRKNSTKTEIFLWQKLKGRQISRCKFIRQQPILNYIVDFYCPEYQLVIEIDGFTHNDQKYDYDLKREKELLDIGLKVLRFCDEDIIKDIDNVVKNIYEFIKKIRNKDGLTNTPLPPSRGERRTSRGERLKKERLKKERLKKERPTTPPYTPQGGNYGRGTDRQHPPTPLKGGTTDIKGGVDSYISYYSKSFLKEEKEKPLISVIIPLYNHASTLKRSLLSLTKQIYKPLEIIIVNDGSTDNFEQSINKIQNSENKIQNLKIFKQKNFGAPVARNRGFKESRGDYVIFWDADIIAKPDMIEKMYLILQDNITNSYVYSQFRLGWKKMKSHKFDEELLKQNNYICTMSLIRRKDFPGFDERLKRFQDWDLWLMMLEQGKRGIFIPQVLFRAIVGFRKGISSWLPSFYYKLPFKIKKIERYKKAKEIVIKKHKL